MSTLPNRNIANITPPEFMTLLTHDGVNDSSPRKLSAEEVKLSDFCRKMALKVSKNPTKHADIAATKKTKQGTIELINFKLNQIRETLGLHGELKFYEVDGFSKLCIDYVGNSNGIASKRKTSKAEITLVDIKTLAFEPSIDLLIEDEHLKLNKAFGSNIGLKFAELINRSLDELFCLYLRLAEFYYIEEKERESVLLNDFENNYTLVDKKYAEEIITAMFGAIADTKKSYKKVAKASAAFTHIKTYRIQDRILVEGKFYVADFKIKKSKLPFSRKFTKEVFGLGEETATRAIPNLRTKLDPQCWVDMYVSFLLIDRKEETIKSDLKIDMEEATKSLSGLYVHNNIINQLNAEIKYTTF
ncbi:hypothetical protein QTV49_004654 [Vibrio vulnificus]|nr:hypothetical protein [Vibrio vulnificus]